MSSVCGVIYRMRRTADASTRCVTCFVTYGVSACCLDCQKVADVSAVSGAVTKWLCACRLDLVLCSSRRPRIQRSTATVCTLASSVFAGGWFTVSAIHHAMNDCRRREATALTRDDSSLSEEYSLIVLLMEVKCSN